MVTASLSAALVTSIWVWVGFKPSDSPTPDALSSVADETGVWKQRLVTAPNHRVGGPSALNSWKTLEGKRTALEPTAAAATVISRHLKRVAEHPDDSTPNWQIDVAQRAHRLWSSHSLVVSFVDRETLSKSELRGCCSVSCRDSRGRLEVMIGVFGASEIRLASWSTVQGRM